MRADDYPSRESSTGLEHVPGLTAKAAPPRQPWTATSAGVASAARGDTGDSVPGDFVRGLPPLTVAALAAAPPGEQKRMIGNRLFPLVQERQPRMAQKITGMILELNNNDLLRLLEPQRPQQHPQPHPRSIPETQIPGAQAGWVGREGGPTSESYT